MTSPLPLSPPVTQINVWATVTSLAPLRVQLDGDPGPLPVTTDSLVAGLQVGDRVWCQLTTNSDPIRRSRRLVVVGKAGGFVDLAAANSLRGNNTGSPAAPADLTVAQARDLLGVTPCYCRVYRTAAQTGIANSAETSVIWTAEESDNSGMHDPATNPERITIPNGADGLFAVTVSLVWSAAGTGQYFVWVTKNSTAASAAIRGSGDVRSAASQTSQTHFEVPLVGGDYLVARVFQSTGAAKDINVGDVSNVQYFPAMSVTRIGPLP